jgi:predicted nucleotidyltransferase
MEGGVGIDKLARHPAWEAAIDEFHDPNREVYVFGSIL